MAVPGSARHTPGFADIFGGKMFTTIDYSGPASYNNTGNPATSGETINHKLFGFENTIECIIGDSIDITGTYYVYYQPTRVGVTGWLLRWFTTAGVEAPNGTNLSGLTVKLAAIGF